MISSSQENVCPFGESVLQDRGLIYNCELTTDSRRVVTPTNPYGGRRAQSNISNGALTTEGGFVLLRQ